MPSKSDLPVVARAIGVPERTLRRAVRRGTVRSRALGPRRVELDAPERAYLAENWLLIAGIMKALRTERNVRLAVIFGSVARGDASADSDIDVLVSLAEERPMYAQHLSTRLEERLGRDVDVLSLGRLRERNPGLLASALADGRPVFDRDDLWEQLVLERESIERAGTEARAARHRRASAAIADLTGDEI